VLERGLESSGKGKEERVGFCENGNELPASMKCSLFLS